MSKSIEEKVEDYFKNRLDNLGITHFGKNEAINDSVATALRNANSKSGGSGLNFPDIQLLLEDGHSRRIPVMIEAKGGKNKLEKLDAQNQIVQVTKYGSDSKPGAKKPHKKGDPNFSTIQSYAVNGALHYGNAILNGSNYSEVIIIGINGTQIRDNKLIDPEQKAYYVSKENNGVPKHIDSLDNNWDLLKPENVEVLFEKLDRLKLTDEEIERLTQQTEADLEKRVKDIHQAIYDDQSLKTMLSTNEKLYLFTGLIMAGLSTEGASKLNVDDLHSNKNTKLNDGSIVLTHIEAFLTARNADEDKISMIIDLLKGVFSKQGLNAPRNGESAIKVIYRKISVNIIPLLESNLHLDFTGKILNSLSDWVSIENDKANDVVLTPRYLTEFMAKLARTNKDSYVWDLAMGSAGFLVSAMDIMINDAKQNIQDQEELAAKIKNIKEQQILGIEILGNIYILAVLNMILMGDGSSHMLNGDSHELYENQNFPANVFLLNPPYSAPGKGFNFVEEALSMMNNGYAAILIQENAGSGNGLPFAKRILKKNTLLTSIHLPNDVFGGKASVQVGIYVFKVNEPHDPDNLVTFIDMSEDGYSRQNRKKSSQAINLRDTDHAKDRYTEVLAIALGKKPKTSYYTEANGKVIRDSISLEGNDWTFSQHQVIDTTPNEDDFKRVVAEYLSWKVSQLLEDGDNND